MTFQVKFECHKSGGLFETHIGDFYFSAKTKAELSEKVGEFIRKHLAHPEVEMIRSGDEIRITTMVGDFYQIHRPIAGQDDGRQMIRHTTTGCLMQGQELRDEIDTQLLQMAQSDWDHVASDPPSWLPESKLDDWRSWVRFQVAYKIATEAGMNSTQAHHEACSVM